MPTPAEEIDKMLAALPGWRGQTLSRLRRSSTKPTPISKKTGSGEPRPGRYNGNVISLGAFKEHVKINFFKGASLDDPNGLFNAGLDAKATRSIDLRESDSINEQALQDPDPRRGEPECQALAPRSEPPERVKPAGRARPPPPNSRSRTGPALPRPPPRHQRRRQEPHRDARAQSLLRRARLHRCRHLHPERQRPVPITREGPRAPHNRHREAALRAVQLRIRIVVVSHDELKDAVEHAPKGFGSKPADTATTSSS